MRGFVICTFFTSSY